MYTFLKPENKFQHKVLCTIIYMCVRDAWMHTWMDRWIVWLCRGQQGITVEGGLGNSVSNSDFTLHDSISSQGFKQVNFSVFSFLTASQEQLVHSVLNGGGLFSLYKCTVFANSLKYAETLNSCLTVTQLFCTCKHLVHVDFPFGS